MSETKTATIIPPRTLANIDGAYRAAAAEQCLCNKWSMVDFKGGRCVVCKILVSESNIGDFEFRQQPVAMNWRAVAGFVCCGCFTYCGLGGGRKHSCCGRRPEGW
jgi:hypothetical protein